MHPINTLLNLVKFFLALLNLALELVQCLKGFNKGPLVKCLPLIIPNRQSGKVKKNVSAFPSRHFYGVIWQSIFPTIGITPFLLFLLKSFPLRMNDFQQ